MTSTTGGPAIRSLGPAAAYFVRQPSVILLLSLWAATWGLRPFAGPVGVADAIAPLVVLLLWPFNEWLIHVFVLHARPREIAGRRIDLPVARKHRAHHRDPRNLAILFIPLGSFAVSLPLAAGLSWLLTPDPAVALTVFGTILTLGLHYEWIHFLAHTNVAPRTRVYREVLRRHRLHHYKNEQHWFGVSVLGADQLLGTSPDADAVPRSPTARRLHEEADAVA